MIKSQSSSVVKLPARTVITEETKVIIALEDVVDGTYKLISKYGDPSKLCKSDIYADENSLRDAMNNLSGEWLHIHD